MGKKHNLETLKKLREEAIKLEEIKLEEMLQTFYLQTVEEVEYLFSLIFEDLESKARDPYAEIIEQNVILTKGNLNLRIGEKITTNNIFQSNILKDRINEKGLYAVFYKQKLFVIYKNDLVKLLDENDIAYEIKDYATDIEFNIIVKLLGYPLKKQNDR